jgi:hypothetical protein
MKNPAIEHLKRLAMDYNRQRYPNFPENARPKPSYSDKKANGLTKCIIDWLRFNGWHAERINTMGVPVDKREIVTDVIGRQRTIGSLEWRRTNSTRGSSDIHATRHGQSLYVEVKIGTDRQSPAQKDFQWSVERAGATYWIAKDFLTFYETYQKNYNYENND